MSTGEAAMRAAVAAPTKTPAVVAALVLTGRLPVWDRWDVRDLRFILPP
ncbi:hypothetical protein [Streptomyces cylindrosporus]|uniref:Uncharacterized protein n=1 Tax=Streptomyces cylindrosporus TaxID=2927583 RepID=A0ABS9Y9F2_9ACTN|nr:hypothetical protein [Streptomyces cylindrosporus]MCI3273130.1 hypothetical protein [Streptomyces cylindrosporus]